MYWVYYAIPLVHINQSFMSIFMSSSMQWISLHIWLSAWKDIDIFKRKLIWLNDYLHYFYHDLIFWKLLIISWIIEC